MSEVTPEYTWAMLMVLAGVGVLVIGGLATVIALLANKSTRGVGVLLIIGVLVLSVFVATVGMFFYTRAGHERRVAVRHINQYPAMQVEQVRRVPDNLHIEAQVAQQVHETTMASVNPTAEVTPQPVVAEGSAVEETTAEETPEAAAETTQGDAVAGESPEETPAAPVEPAAPVRPAWVDAEPGTVDGAYQVVVEVGPYKTAEGCDLEQPAKLQVALNQYVQRFIGPAAVRHVRFDPTLYEQVVKETWEETGEFTVGPMLHRYLLLRFDNKAMRLIEDQYRQVIVQSRVWYTGLGLTGIVLLLGVAFTVLKVDLAFGGKYRIRMALATMMALGLLVFVALVGMRLIFQGTRFDPYPVHATATEVVPTTMNSFAVTIPAAEASAVTTRIDVLLLVLATGAGFVVLLLVSAVIAFRKRHKRRFEGVGVSGNIEP